MTKALGVFELEMYRAERLDYALRYVRSREAEIGPELTKAKALGLPVPVTTKEEFLDVVLGGVTIGSLALFWRGFHLYRTSLNPTPSQRDIERVCPDYKVRCHRGHPEDHVLRFLRDLRNTEIHPGAAYQCITCDRPADDIIFQSVLVREYQGKRITFLLHDLARAERFAWIESVNAPWAAFEWTTLGEFLIEEAAACVRAYDTKREAKPVPRRTPLEYPKYDPVALGLGP